MNKILLLLSLLLGPAGFCADNLTVFRTGLQAFQANGPDALLSNWYNGREDSAKVARAREQLTKFSQTLGPVVDTEVFAPKNLGRRIQRIYGAIYFERRPVWVRAEFYTVEGRSGILSLELSTNSEEILPLEWASSGRD